MHSSKDTIKFLLTALALYLLWYLFYDLWLLPDKRLDLWLCRNVAQVSGSALNLFGFEGAANDRVVMINNYPSVLVGIPCNGLILFVLFAGFIIAYPGPWKAKLFYIPIGIFIIYVLNVIRVIALAINGFYSKQTLDFNHKYTFTFIVYAFIFGFWMYWVKRYAKQPVTNLD
jgi:exosortase family protein XrtF